MNELAISFVMRDLVCSYLWLNLVSGWDEVAL